MSALSKPKKINKDWGYEIWMANNEEENYCGKILYIKAGHSTSMHFHAKKHETFYILEGVLELELICTASTKKYKKVLNKEKSSFWKGYYHTGLSQKMET